MESMEFLHAGRIFTLLFVDDFTFSEVRAILDDLLAQNAFQGYVQEEGNPFLIDADGSSFRVWVSEMRVAIERL
jgi:hypothetical protein